MPTILQMRHGAAPEEHDAVRSVTHLVDSVAFGLKHAWRHHASALERAEEVNGGDIARVHSLAWNVEHALRHVHGAEEHANKLIPHIGKHPDIAKHIAPASLQAIVALCAQVGAQMTEVRKCYDACFRLLEPIQRGERATTHLVVSHLNAAREHFLATEAHVSEIVTRHLAPYPAANDEQLRLTSANPMPDHPVDAAAETIVLLRGYRPLHES